MPLERLKSVPKVQLHYNPKEQRNIRHKEKIDYVWFFKVIFKFDSRILVFDSSLAFFTSMAFPRVYLCSLTNDFNLSL